MVHRPGTLTGTSLPGHHLIDSSEWWVRVAGSGAPGPALPSPLLSEPPSPVSRPLAPLAHPDSKLERRAEEQTSSYQSPYPGLYGQGQELGFPVSGSQEPSWRDRLNTVRPTSQPLPSHAKPPAHSPPSGQQSYPAPWKARTAKAGVPAVHLLGGSCPSQHVQEMPEGHCSWTNRTNASRYLSDHSLWTQGSILAFGSVVSIGLGTL